MVLVCNGRFELNPRWVAFAWTLVSHLLLFVWLLLYILFQQSTGALVFCVIAFVVQMVAVAVVFTMGTPAMHEEYSTKVLDLLLTYPSAKFKRAELVYCADPIAGPWVKVCIEENKYSESCIAPHEQI